MANVKDDEGCGENLDLTIICPYFCNNEITWILLSLYKFLTPACVIDHMRAAEPYVINSSVVLTKAYFQPTEIEIMH